MTELSEIFKKTYATVTTRYAEQSDAYKEQLAALKQIANDLSVTDEMLVELKGTAGQMFLKITQNDGRDQSSFDVTFGEKHGKPTIILSTNRNNPSPVDSNEGGYDLTSSAERKAMVSTLATQIATRFSKWDLARDAVNNLKAKP